MLALALAGLLAAASPTPSDSLDALGAGCLSGDVVTRADLRAAGVTAIHEALRLSPALGGVTTDGFDLRPVAPSGVPFAEPVRVLLDGAPVARGGGVEPDGLEALPVALAEVAAVVVCPGDGLAGGALGGPWIDVQTAAPARWAYAGASYGNETGDPGPLRYTDPALPNVDKWGPDYEAALAAGGAAWLAVRARDFLPTDPAIFDRTLAATTPDRYPKRQGSTLAAAGRGAGLRVRVGGRSFDDLAFVPAAGREVPIDHASAQATVSGERRRGPLRLRGHGHAGTVRLDRPAWGALALDPSWEDVRAEGALSATLERGPESVAVGARVRHVRAEAPSFEDVVTSAQGWARAALSEPSGGLALSLGVEAAGGRAGPLATLDGWLRRGPLRFRGAASARRTVPEATLDAAAWAGRGYRPFGDAGQGETGSVARALGEVAFASGGVRASVSGEVQRSRQPAPVGVARGTAGRLVARVSASGRHVRFGAAVTAQGALGGTDAFRAAWDRLPGLSASVDATVRPDGRLALWARLEAREATTWAGFDPSGVPAAFLLDLGLSKPAWGDRLRLGLGGRNVLGGPEQTHPLGADLAPRLYLRAEARL